MKHVSRRWIAAVALAGAALCTLALRAQETPEQAATLQENTRLLDRRGRIVNYQLDVLGEPTATKNDRSAFVSIDDNRTFILLENRKLEALERITRRGEKVIKLSGTLQTYRGKNYLLITRYQVREDKPREEEW